MDEVKPRCPKCGIILFFGNVHNCRPKSSGGGVESGHAAQHGVDTAGVRVPKVKTDVSGIRSIAGVAPSPPEASTEKKNKKVKDGTRFDRTAYQREFMRKWRAKRARSS